MGGNRTTCSSCLAILAISPTTLPSPGHPPNRKILACLAARQRVWSPVPLPTPCAESMHTRAKCTNSLTAIPTPPTHLICSRHLASNSAWSYCPVVTVTNFQETVPAISHDLTVPPVNLRKLMFGEAADHVAGGAPTLSFLLLGDDGSREETSTLVHCAHGS